MKETDLFEELVARDITALSRAITIVESSLPKHRASAMTLVSKALALDSQSVRIAISGTPGAGKSTLIDKLGMQFIRSGSRVAVLAVDPSSPRSGGSILGDKTRMDELSAHPSAYVRPSPSRGTGGGVTRSTREAIILAEVAGFDIIIVETVGVGQSELAVHSMVDIFILLGIAGAGDELQGIKRGALELADIVVVTKADGDNLNAAESARASLLGTVKLLPTTHAGWQREVITTSVVDGLGLDQLWESIDELRTLLVSTGQLRLARRRHIKDWFEDTVTHLVADRIRNDPAYQTLITRLEDDSMPESSEDTPLSLASAYVSRLFD